MFFGKGEFGSEFKDWIGQNERSPLFLIKILKKTSHFDLFNL